MSAMSEKRKKELAAKFGLDELPEPRYADLPPEHEPPPLSQLVNFKKALACVDALSTAAFTKFIPDNVVIDQSIDTRSFQPDSSRAVMIRADLPIPVNPRIARVLRMDSEPNDQNLFRWLSIELRRYWDEWRVRAMGPPLIFRTYWTPSRPALIGLILKLDLRPREDGMKWEDQRSRIGILAGRSPKEDQGLLETSHRV